MRGRGDRNKIIMTRHLKNKYNYSKNNKCKDCSSLIVNYAKNYCAKCKFKHFRLSKKGLENIRKARIAKIGIPHPRKGTTYISRHKCIVCPRLVKENNMKYCSRKCMGINKRGEKNYFWRGGISSINELQRNQMEYKNFRRAVLKRDDYRCFDCGARSGETGHKVKLQVDHVYPFSLFSRIRFDIDNGQTVCKKCHENRTREFMREYNRGFFKGRTLREYLSTS